jgi:hypothetical protein
MSASVITDVIEVIKKMMEFIPTEETQLINDLKIFKEALWNQAPELRCTHFWIPMTSILQRNIECIDEPWKTEIVKLFNDGKAEIERLEKLKLQKL